MSKTIEQLHHELNIFMSDMKRLIVVELGEYSINNHYEDNDEILKNTLGKINKLREKMDSIYYEILMLEEEQESG